MILLIKILITLPVIFTGAYFFFWNTDCSFYRSTKGGIWEKRVYGAERSGGTFWERKSENPKGNFKVLETDDCTIFQKMKSN